MKPILFNTDMVRAILEGRKTVTRRVVKEPWFIEDEGMTRVSGYAMHRGYDYTHGMPYSDSIYHPGDILYVRETWNYGYCDTTDFEFRYNETFFEELKPGSMKDSFLFPRYFYRTEDLDGIVGMKWRPSIHMPREAARIFLRVTDVRVERLQEIDDAQAYAEGAEGVSCNCDVSEVFCSRCCNTGWLISPRSEFARIWDSTIKPKDRALCGWEANPWVWGIEFERCGKPKGD